MARKTVPAAAVRTWGRANLDLIPEVGHKCLGDTARGRLHPEVVSAYRKAHKGKTYETGAAEDPTVTFRGATLDSIGRKTTKEVTLTTAEARALLGHEKGRKGRLSMTLVREAWEATEANRLADQFVTDAA